MPIFAHCQRRFARLFSHAIFYKLGNNEEENVYMQKLAKQIKADKEKWWGRWRLFLLN